MRRRAFIGLAASAIAVPRTLAQARLPLVGVLIHGTPDAYRQQLGSLVEGLGGLGHVDGKTCRIEVRYGDNRFERLPAIARELLALRPDVVVASLVRSAQALHRETKTVPIVMASGAGAQNLGLIASLARPGGNVTGLTNQGDELTAKLFELLKEIAPKAKRVITLSSGLGSVESEVRMDSRAAASRQGLELIEALVDAPDKLSALAGRCERERCEALVTLLDPSLYSFRKEIIAFAARLRIPTVYAVAGFAHDGGLIAYSVNAQQLWRRAATYVDKILKGAKPADLPIEQPTHFELVINRKTAKTLGIRIPESLLVRADRVID